MRDALLDCLHRVHNIPESWREGRLVRCWDTCNGTESEVVRILEPNWEWVAECLVCSYVRKCGQAAALASMWTAKHRRSTGHSMRMRKSTEFTMVPDDNEQLELW